MNVGKTNNHQDWTTLHQDWMKYNTDPSKNRKNKKTTICYVYRNENRRFLYKKGSIIEDLPILVAETLHVQEALKDVMKEKCSRVSLRATL